MFKTFAFTVAFLVVHVLSQSPRILIYSATRAFRHDSIPTAIEALQNASNAINVRFDSTEDQALFNDQNLARYDAILFLSTTGEVLDDAGKASFQKYINSGGNFIGIHSASDTLVNATFYERELGAHFDYHADLQEATVDVVGPSHPSTDKLPRRWQTRDEWYNFKSDPRDVGAVVILSVDESTYSDTGTRRFNQGTPHPTAWYQEHGAGATSGGVSGRSFYTSLGHLNETWRDETFMGHVLGGIVWTLEANTTKAFNNSALVGSDGGPPTPTGSQSGVSGTSDATGTHTPSPTSNNATAPMAYGTLLAVMFSTLAVALYLL
ncbi:Class I glutamine amidotransferase-like protein [Pleurotus pulmonarius]